MGDIISEFYIILVIYVVLEKNRPIIASVLITLCTSSVNNSFVYVYPMLCLVVLNHGYKIFGICILIVGKNHLMDFDLNLVVDSMFLNKDFLRKELDSGTFWFIKMDETLRYLFIFLQAIIVYKYRIPQKMT